MSKNVYDTCITVFAVITYDFFLLQIGFHPLAVVSELVQKEESDRYIYTHTHTHIHTHTHTHT